MATGNHPFIRGLQDRQFKKVIVFDPRYQVNYGTLVYSFDEFFEALYAGNSDSFIITYRPRYPKDEFPLMCQYLRDVPFEDTLFFVDEVSMVCDFYAIPPEFQDLIRFGRHNRIGVLMTAQRPIDVNRDLTAQCNHLFIFHQHEPRDIQYFGGFMGQDAGRLQDLKDFAFIYHDFGRTIKIVDKDLKVCQNKAQD